MDRVRANNHAEIEHEGRNIRVFSDGDAHSFPQVPATDLQSEFLNSVQEEICRFIEGQGLDLNSQNLNQLSEAIKKASYYPYDFVCNSPDDLQKLLKENSGVDNLSIRVDADQEITERVVFTGKNLCITGGKWGVAVTNKIPDSEFQAPFISLKNGGLRLNDLQLDKFKYLVTFAETNLKVAILTNCILFTDHSDEIVDGSGSISTIYSASSFAVKSYNLEN